MSSYRLTPALLAAAALLSAGTSVHLQAASHGRPVSVEERVNGSARVVVARATDVKPAWRSNQWGDRIIVSRVVLEVQETLKGRADRQVVMDLEGGSVDGVSLEVSSLPALGRGERAVFFLDDSGSGTFQPHLRGLGILKLGDDDVVRGSSLKLEDIRDIARQVGR